MGATTSSNVDVDCQHYIDNYYIPVKEKFLSNDVDDIANKMRLDKKFESGRGGGFVYKVYMDYKYRVLKIFPNNKIDENINEVGITNILSHINKDKNINYFPELYQYGNINTTNPFSNTTNKSGKYNYMIIEFIPGTPFIDYIENIKYDIVADEILFQILHALYIIRTICAKFKHNDLHPGNIILVRDYINKYIDLNGSKYYIGTTKVKIIDFGMGSLYGKTRSGTKPISRTLIRFLKSKDISTARAIKNLLAIKTMGYNSNMSFWLMMKMAFTNPQNFNENKEICKNILDCLHKVGKSLKKN